MTSRAVYQVHSVSVSNSGASVLARPGVASASPAPRGTGHCAPVAISPSQAYYWKRSWQEAEHEALEEIRAGKARTFESAEAAIRYLLAPGDE
jgi:hypothetical protein